MKIYRLKRDFQYHFGMILVMDKRGDLFCEEIRGAPFTNQKERLFYPTKGGYPIYEKGNFEFIDELLEFVEETEHPKEYHIDKKYTEHDMQTAIANAKTANQ